jgi:hypothetical protein
VLDRGVRADFSGSGSRQIGQFWMNRLCLQKLGTDCSGYGEGVPGEPLFRMVCVPAALDGAREGWAADMLREGEVALLVDGGGLDAVNAVARALEQTTVRVVRTEPTVEQQEDTVMAYAASLPLVWVAPGFSDAVRTWARERGPMTLLIDVDGALPEVERRRIERFLAILGRQSE